VATVNINEQMNQLGQLGTVGYDPTDAVVEALLGRTRRARVVRQGSAALIGSVGAVGLGILGARIFVNLNDADDPALRDRNLIDNDFAFLDMPWNDRYSEDYTGLDKTREEILAAWNSLHASAAETPQTPTATTEAPAAPNTPKPATPSCTYEEHEWNGGTKWRSPDSNCEWVYPEPVVPAGWIDFGGTLGQCKNYYDVATGATVWAAFIDAGESYKKIVRCEGGPTDYWSGSYQYIYNGPAGGGWHATLSGTTCTGFENTVGNDVYQYSCKPGADLWQYVRTIEPTPTPSPEPPPS
jgi:hypothetical protein